ncbi:hypothetical protein CERSUDRAFT_59360 [Gelatoporia subvermispora B]|uniref:Protein kinase domain-containing protein n=1 Tax=Ceriporiopsis subvermispora (strain B) TaxID=914234 RepID=M2R153_CERS8|nr:hypothetical protein CERSUDRAFT_59360 [Gelatoporia subvermispora B]
MLCASNGEPRSLSPPPHRAADSYFLWQELVRNIVSWRHLRHPNIVRYYGVAIFEHRLCIVSEWLQCGTLRHYLVHRPEANRIKLVRLHSFQMSNSRGLAYLHSLGVVHADVRATHIMIDGMNIARLINFGLATLPMDDQADLTPTSPMTLAIRWAAPELLDPESFGINESTCTPKCDVYSFSMTMWEVFTGLIPFHECRYDGIVILGVMSGVRPDRPSTSDALSIGLNDAMWALMEKCWSHNPSQRPDIDGVLAVLMSQDVEPEYRPSSWPLVLDVRTVSAHFSRLVLSFLGLTL